MEFRSQREFCVDELLHKIMKIWDLLCVDETSRETFKDETYGLREENVKKVSGEARCLCGMVRCWPLKFSIA